MEEVDAEWMERVEKAEAEERYRRGGDSHNHSFSSPLSSTRNCLTRTQQLSRDLARAWI
jgi:hypothetical protein